ncbi:protein phosphatase 1 regulatory subunit 36 isoform X2 [Balaenoptera ricei]|uniref:protein phosphatase 1 regulatory subunit 36 isoform X2 n=1 Tax=Balaenoptera ricei TaxID=2746895 RepID=UPI0028BDCCF3|nr:protein phosphatase 1 regulatory subunit 36 isoform X2 [Balaenoptera ricei]
MGGSDTRPPPPRRKQGPAPAQRRRGFSALTGSCLREGRSNAASGRPRIACPSFIRGGGGWTRRPTSRIFTPAVELKERGKKGKAVHFAEIDGPASDRLTDKRFALRDDKSPKGLEKRSQQGNVTLHDAKFVALLLLQDTEMQHICSFTTFMRNKNLDNFLMALLYYLYYYLEKISQEKKPKSCMVGLVEKKEMELVISKLEAAQKYLAQKYCVLVLGLGMPDKHHMCCGKGKISDTQKDWKFFESFYTFCTYVAWIVFRRQHFTEIEEEIGRLFRSDMFNIPRRKREDEESGGEKKRMTFVQFRRMMAKRPAMKKAINMRSPVMSTLLPSLREKAQNISEKKYRQVGMKFPARMQEHKENLDSVHMPIGTDLNIYRRKKKKAGNGKEAEKK